MNEELGIQFVDQPDEGEDIQFVDQASPSSLLGKALHAANQMGIFGLAGHLLARGSDNPQSNPQPKVASGVWEAAKAGYESSATGLLTSGHMPDLVLDPEHARWYEKLVAGGAQMAADLPEMVIGGGLAGLAGIESGPGAAVVAGAGAFAVPTLIRSALTEAYSKGSVRSSGDFLLRTGIVIKETSTDALIGGLTSGTGIVATKMAAPLGKTAAGIVGAGSEVGVMTVAPAALQGQLPEPEDFTNGIILLAGMKGGKRAYSYVHGKVDLSNATRKMMAVYAKTGIRPEQVVADAQKDPSIAADLFGEVVPVAPEVQFAVGAAPKAELWHGNTRTGETSLSVEGGSKTNIMGGGLHLSVDKTTPESFAGHDPAGLWNVKLTEEFKPFDARGARSYTSVEAAKLGVTGPDGITGLEVWRELRFQLGGSEQATEHLRKLGFDGLAYDEMGGREMYSVWNKSRIEGSERPEIPEAYRAAAIKQNSVDAVPGVARQVAMEPFGPPVRVSGEPEPTKVNYKYLDSNERIEGALERMSELNLAEIQRQRRGVVSHDQTISESIKEMAELLGVEGQPLPREPGTADGAARITARKQLMKGFVEDMQAQAKAIAEAGGDVPFEQTADYLASVVRADNAAAYFLGARAELGRGLEALKITKTSAEQAKVMREIIKKAKADPAELARMMAELNNPASVLKMAKEMNRATTYDMIIEAWKAALVSGPITQTANAMGNTTFLAMRPAVDAVAAVIGVATGRADRVHFSEPLARMVGDIQGVADGLRLAKAAFLLDAPGGKAEHQMKIPGKTGHYIRTPFRALAAGDALFRAMAERGEAYSLASRKAIAEGHSVATREFRERLVELANNPDAATAKEIKAAGARFVFNAPLGKHGRAVQQMVKANHLEWAVPFISTPGNVFKEMARLTPAAPIIGEWRADFAKGGPAMQKALGEMALGTGLSTLAMALATAGHLSGGGDPDPNKRRIQMAAGWQPYSVKIDGTWYSYQRLQPVGTLIGMAADMAEVWENLNPEDSDKIPKILATAFANAVTNQTFLQGIAQLVGAVSDPDRDGPRFLNALAGSLVPAIIGQTAAMFDPYQREISSVKDAVQNRIPGLRNQMEPSRDPFGEPIASPERILGVSPIATKEQSSDPVRTEAARLEIGEGKAPKAISLPAAGIEDVGRVPLTPEQRGVFGDEAGHMAHKIMEQMVASPGWEYMPDDLQRKAFKTAFEMGHKYGKMAALPPEQLRAEISRITQELSIKLRSK